MLYILTENWYSGSVTVGTQVSAVEAPDFEIAKTIARDFISKANGRVIMDSGGSLNWRFPDEEFYSRSGYMTSEPLKVLNS